jgi:hypothetical protein
VSQQGSSQPSAAQSKPGCDVRAEAFQQRLHEHRLGALAEHLKQAEGGARMLVSDLFQLTKQDFKIVFGTVQGIVQYNRLRDARDEGFLVEFLGSE